MDGGGFRKEMKGVLEEKDFRKEMEGDLEKRWRFLKRWRRI